VATPAPTHLPSVTVVDCEDLCTFAMQQPIAIELAKELATIRMPKRFTLRFAIQGTGNNDGNILEISNADHSNTLLTIASTSSTHIQVYYSDYTVPALADVLPPDWQEQVVWTTIELTVSTWGLSISSSYNLNPALVTEFPLMNTTDELFLLRVSSDDQYTSAGNITDIEISGTFAFPTAQGESLH
jgi:hypothetical protein